jgi:hypothetical protein
MLFSADSAIFVANGRMNYTCTTTLEGGGAIPRSGPLLPAAQDWTMKVEVHLDPFNLTSEGQFSDLFLGVGKTGDEFNNHVMFEFGRGRWGLQNGYYIEGNGRTNGTDTPALFELGNINITAAMAALRLDYEASNHRLTFYWDADAATGGYQWVSYGGTFLNSGTYNMNLAPSETLTVLLVGSSEFQTVAEGQAYFDNFELTIQPPFTWTTNNGNITITRYTGAGGEVILPATVTGLPVTAIGDSAFNGRTNVASVNIPDSVTRIGDSAFYRCYGLTNVILGKQVETIDGWAFSWCTNLPALHLPESVRAIGASAFNYCLRLASVNIPDGVPAIERFTFYHCSSLININLPDSATRIDDSAFAMCAALNRVVAGRNVSLLGDQVFYICPNLAGVYFGGNAPVAGTEIFTSSTAAKVYYLPGTTGWEATFAGRPTALWVLPYPVVLTCTPNFGIQTDTFGSKVFGFTVSWASNAVVVIEATASLANPAWSPVRTNALVSGSYQVTDPQWVDYTSRFYRARKQ